MKECKTCRTPGSKWLPKGVLWANRCDLRQNGQRELREALPANRSQTES